MNVEYIVSCTIEYTVEAHDEREAREIAESKFYSETRTTPDYSDVCENN